jgi:hypothetical protein
MGSRAAPARAFSTPYGRGPWSRGSLPAQLDHDGTTDTWQCTYARHDSARDVQRACWLAAVMERSIGSSIGGHAKALCARIVLGS